MTSTRSSRELSDALSRHDATMKKRFQRALLCSFVINGAAWSAFAGQKSTPVFHDLGAQSPQTMQWTMTTADARAATSPAPTALFDNARKSAVAILDNSPLSPTSQAPSQKRLRNLPERESALETEKPRRAPSQNSSSQSKLQNNAQRESATTRVRSASQAQISPDWSEENAWHSNDYPLEHSDHSRDETARNSSQTSSTRSANDAQKSLDSTGKSARQSASTRAPSSEQNANARNNAPSSRRESVGASSPQSLASSSKLGSSSNVASSQLGLPSSGASADSSSKRDGSRSESSTRSLPNEAQRESAQRESAQRESSQRELSKREPLIEPSKREPQQREPQQRATSDRAAPQSAPKPRIVREAEVVSRARVKLPHHLRREKRRVSVLIESDIDERGHVEARVKRSSGDKDLDEVVLRAARKTRFKPRQEDGVATKTKKETRYDIGVEDSENNSDNDDSP